MKTLVLLRHGESVWNLENRFTGWTDVDLSEKGVAEAKSAGQILKHEGYAFNMAFTSVLLRANRTLQLALSELSKTDIQVIRSWKLNERHYGALQGMNKSEMAKLYGEEQIQIWRRSYAVRPPQLQVDDSRNPAHDERYKDVPRHELPLTESLKDTVARVIPYYEQEILPQMERGKRIIIAAHGNSLRALVMHFEHLSEEEISRVNIPTGIPLVYEFDDSFAVHNKKYLGDSALIDAKMQAVAAQGKKK